MDRLSGDEQQIPPLRRRWRSGSGRNDKVVRLIAGAEARFISGRPARRCSAALPRLFRRSICFLYCTGESARARSTRANFS
jgi:hypothetical protein